MFSIIAGYVAPVAPFRKFSWYNLLIMENVYSEGYSGEENGVLQWQRRAAAVRAVGDFRASTITPRREIEDSDVTYQLICIYAEEMEKQKHCITTHLHNNGDFVYLNYTTRYSLS